MKQTFWLLCSSLSDSTEQQWIDFIYLLTDLRVMGLAPRALVPKVLMSAKAKHCSRTVLVLYLEEAIFVASY